MTRTMQASRGFVWFVGAGPGDPELITLRGWQALQAADVVLHDALVDDALVADLTARLVDVGKRCGRHAMTQEAISALLVTLALEGNRVVRLKGGDASVLGRVGEEALALAEAGLRFEIVPGVSSVTAVPSTAGIPVTHRGLADSFLVATAHHQQEGTAVSVPPYKASTTVLLLMARGTARAWQQQLLSRGYPPELPVALISAGCTPQARLVETTIDNAVEDLERSALETPLMAVVGWVVTLRPRLEASLDAFSPWPPATLASPEQNSPPIRCQTTLRPVVAGVALGAVKDRS
ncbi:MAG: uroporphyrinogen-III C-methyltransferase [bacterium]|nr:uroporphyrinogen-III C-methyltransferase [bacterium]